MPRHDAMIEGFEEVTVLNKPALFTTQRLDRTTIPAGYHLYEVRHDDSCRSRATQLANIIHINLWGSLVTRDEIKLPRDGVLGVTPDDFTYHTGSCQSMSDFMMRYPLCTQEW